MVDKIVKNSIIDIRTKLLPDYEDFQRVNDDWSVEKHLNLNYDIDAAIAFSKLYFPTFITYKGCIILESRFDIMVFNDWFNEFKGDIGQVERMCNLYEVKDIFHINDSNITEEKIEELGNILKKSWELNTNMLYPNRDIEVFLFLEDDNLYITINSTEKQA